MLIKLFTSPIPQTWAAYLQTLVLFFPFKYTFPLKNSYQLCLSFLFRYNSKVFSFKLSSLHTFYSAERSRLPHVTLNRKLSISAFSRFWLPFQPCIQCRIPNLSLNTCNSDHFIKFLTLSCSYWLERTMVPASCSSQSFPPALFVAWASLQLSIPFCPS